LAKVRKPWPARFTFLTRRLRPSVGPLEAGRVVVEDLGPPAGKRLAERAHLADRVEPAALDRLVQERLGVCAVLGQ
jgi:hypothetical protein